MRIGARGKLKIALIVSALLLFLLVFYPIQLVLTLARSRFSDRIPLLFWRVFNRLIGLKVRTLGHFTARRPLLITANHVSWLDIPVLGALLPLSFVAKADVAGWPVVGHLAWLQRTVYIDRARRAATAETNSVIADRLAAGDALVLFPEGTSHDGNTVLPFRSSLLGGVRDAIGRASTADSLFVQPVALAYRGHRGLPMDRARRPAYAWYGDMELAPHAPQVLVDGVIEVDVLFGAPVEVTASTDRKSLTRALEAEVRRLLAEGLAGRHPEQLS